MSVNQKKRGRPGRDGSRLSREAIIAKAKELMLKENKQVSIRALASHLDVDPMAIYHYFANKAELLEALTVSIMEGIYKPQEGRNWQGELTTLCHSYLELLGKHPGLLETFLSMKGVDAPAEVFRERFCLAVKPLQLQQDQQLTTLNLLVDYLHGYALAYQCAADRKLTTTAGTDGPLQLIFNVLNQWGGKAGT